MRSIFTFMQLLCLFVLVMSCEKDEKTTGCFSNSPTVREISNKKATVVVTATATESVYLVEENTIDTRLIPCNFPPEFYQNGLVVTISGEVKATQQTAMSPCCAENFVITGISR